MRVSLVQGLSLLQIASNWAICSWTMDPIETAHEVYKDLVPQTYHWTYRINPLYRFIIESYQIIFNRMI